MAQQNETFAGYIKGLSWPLRILVICLLPALIIHVIVSHLLPIEKREFWKKHALWITLGITVIMIMGFCLFIEANNKENSTTIAEYTDSIMNKDEPVSSEVEESEDEKVKKEEEGKAKKAEEEEKARLAEEERAKKAEEEAERQRQKEAVLQEQMSRAPVAFANPLGHKGEIIAVTGSVIVDYAYKKNDTHKYTDSLPAGAKDGWGGFWIDTQYGKCYAEYGRDYGPKKAYYTGDTITFVGKVVSDESSYEPVNGIVAPLWIDATEDF